MRRVECLFHLRQTTIISALFNRSRNLLNPPTALKGEHVASSSLFNTLRIYHGKAKLMMCEAHITSLTRLQHEAFTLQIHKQPGTTVYVRTYSQPRGISCSWHHKTLIALYSPGTFPPQAFQLL